MMVSKMAKKVRLIFILFVGIIIVAVASLAVVNILNDENKLTVEENKWINNNLSTVLNVNVINDLDIFGKSGAGVFYDFLNDLGKEYNLKINPVTYTSKDENITSGFIATNTKNDKFVEFYADNYVLLKKDYVYYNNIEAIKDIKIGVLKSDADYIKGYFNEDKNIEFKSFDTYDALKESFNKDLDYIMVPKYELTSDILEKNYSVVYEFSDIKKYYGYYMLDDNFSSVIKKYYNKWQNKKYKNAFNTNLKNTLVKSIKLSEVEQKELTSHIYNYGFVNNNPYEIILGGNYSGIVSVYLKNFSEMAGVDFKYIKYRTYKQLTNAIKEHPFSVVLFDEIEKAHVDIFNVLLQILDDGHVTDAQGRKVDFKNTIIIMTSNLGSQYLLDGIDADGNISPEAEKEVMEDLQGHFRPEFLNRLDEIIMFKPLSKENIGGIIRLLMDDLNKRLSDREIKVALSPEAEHFVVEHGYDPVYGARPLKRFLQKHVETLSAKLILEDQVRQGDTILIDVKDGALTASVQK